MAGCSAKETNCKVPYKGFTIYEAPKPLKVSGSTKKELLQALKAVAKKSRVQAEIIKMYEKDIKRYYEYIAD